MGAMHQTLPFFSEGRAAGHHSQRPVTPAHGSGSDRCPCHPRPGSTAAEDLERSAAGHTAQPAIESSELKKGDALATARIAAIQAAKKTSDLIPLCHPLPITKVSVDLTIDHDLPGVVIDVTCKVRGQTGIEMEALTAASVAALTLYDMAKGIDRGMVIEQTALLHKSGGKTGEW